MRNSMWVGAALVLATVTLSGCFPLVATGVVAGALMVDDRRTSGTYVEDEGIEFKAGQQIKDKFADQVHVNITSYNRNVLLTGEVPTEAIKTEVGQIVSGIANVKGIYNELMVAGNSSFSSRSNDTYLTSKVKARMVDANKFAPYHVKVVTENATVYLMGIVKKQEASDAVDIARSTGGVEKVVKLFEYLD